MTPSSGCGTRRGPPARQVVDGRTDHARGELGQRVVQARRRARGADRHPLHGEDRAGVQRGLHLDDGDPGLPVAREQGALDRRGAAPARQQRGVQVDAAETWRLEDGFGQDQTVGGDHGEIRAQAGERLLLRRVPEGRRRAYREAELDGRLVHRRRPRLQATPGRPRRLRVHGEPRCAGRRRARAGSAPRMRRCPCTPDAEVERWPPACDSLLSKSVRPVISTTRPLLPSAARRSSQPLARCRFALASLRRIMVRLSADR